MAKLRQAARVLERIAEDHVALGNALAAVDRAVIEASVAEESLRDGVQSPSVVDPVIADKLTYFCGEVDRDAEPA